MEDKNNGTEQELVNTATTDNLSAKAIIVSEFAVLKQNIDKNSDELSEKFKEAKKEIDEKFQSKDDEIKGRFNATGIVIDDNHNEFVNWTQAHIESHLSFMNTFNRIRKTVIGLMISSVAELIIIIAILFKIL